MKNTGDSDQHATLRVQLSHREQGDIGEGMLTFGYGCIASVALDILGLKVELNDDQFADGLLATGSDGRKFSLLNCTRKGHAIYPEFVVRGDARGSQFDSFEVRYSEVSEWFFQQMDIDVQIGEEIKWQVAPTPMVASVATPSDNFRVESFYVGTLEGSGEDRTLHQHFEFRFTATKNRFSPVEVKRLALRFANLLSILLARPCPIVSVDVSPEGGKYGRMYYGVNKSPPNDIRQEDHGRLTWHKFLALKGDVDDCWDDVVNAFFRSAYREVIWSRLAGMQNHEGFWEYRVLGYVTLLDSYVSQRFDKGTPKMLPKKNLARLKAALADIQPSLDLTQQAAVLDAAGQVFSRAGTFASKFQALLDSLDPDVAKIINLTLDDFDLVKELRDEVAHGSSLRSRDRTSPPYLKSRTGSF